MIDRARLIVEAEALEASAKRLRAMADEIAAPPAGSPTPATAAGLQTPAEFFARVRRTHGSLSTSQVDGMNAILETCAGRFPVGWTAYVLATAHHETGASFRTDAVESLNYSVDGLMKTFSRARISAADCKRLGRAPGRPADQEAIANLIYGGEWGRKNLGNGEPGDGWKYRGRAWPQLTGRTNYAKADAALGLGGALVADPSIIGRLAICAPVTREGMRAGWFTGLGLNDVIPATEGTLETFTSARRIINGTDRADEIAKIALDYQADLIAGGWL